MFCDKVILEVADNLKDLSIIDYRTRLLLFKMIIDIEHYLKIRILANGFKVYGISKDTINKLRNVVAHNSCVLCKLDKKDNTHELIH